MKTINAHLFTDGTAALKLTEESAAQTQARIIPFPSLHAGSRTTAKCAQHARPSRMRSILDASEMYCSLKYEDYKGCAYNMFTKRGIAALASASSALAVLSLVFGA